MKIAILSDDFPPTSFGGAGIIAFNIAEKLKFLGNEVFVITTVREKREEGVEECGGLKVFKIYSNYPERWRSYLSLYNPSVIRTIEKILTQEKPDVVHAHNIHFYLSYYSLKIAKRCGAKVFLTAHDVMTYAYGKVLDESRLSLAKQATYAKLRFNPFRNIFIKRILKNNVDKIFAVSQSLKMALTNNGINNVEVLWNGIDVNKWSISAEETEEFKKTLGISPSKKVILCGGRLSGMKGSIAAIKAFALVADKFPETVLLIMGAKNEYAEKMTEYAKKNNVGGKIVFTGWISGNKIKAAYSAADIVVVASVYLDPFPTINLEAMASSKPVVGTVFGGTKEVVEDEKTGYIANPNDALEFAEKISELLLDASKAKKFGQAGGDRIRKMFSEEAQIKKLLFWYNSKLNEND